MYESAFVTPVSTLVCKCLVQSNRVTAGLSMPDHKPKSGTTLRGKARIGLLIALQNPVDDEILYKGRSRVFARLVR